MDLIIPLLWIPLVPCYRGDMEVFDEILVDIKEYGQHGGSKNYQDWDAGENDVNSKNKHHFHAQPRILVHIICLA